MIYARIILVILFPLILFYYVTVVLQKAGLIRFFEGEMTFRRSLIPFYYWIKSSNKNNSTTTKKQKQNAKS